MSVMWEVGAGKALSSLGAPVHAEPFSGGLPSSSNSLLSLESGESAGTENGLF